jgi:hypothetical protein
MLFMSNVKQSWRHPKELKYMAIIAHNHKGEVITNLLYQYALSFFIDEIDQEGKWLSF